MNLLALIALAVAPCLAIALFVSVRDKYEKESLRSLAKLFGLGVLATVPVGILQAVVYRTGIAEGESFASVGTRAFFLAGTIEEGAKFSVFLLAIYRAPEFNEPFDGIVYAVMVSMGFATAENILYVVEGGYEVGLLRMFTAVPAHATFGVVMGYFLGRSKFSPRRPLLMLSGLLSAVALHGTYDFCLMAGEYPFLAIGGLFSLIIGVVLSFNAMKESTKISPFRIPPSNEG
jgi:RsiW-degrading membrane proteinase PrsW (M82 family)